MSIIFGYRSMCVFKEGNSMTDEEIVELILQQNETGLSMLAEKYEKLLIYIATAILGNRIRDIEECVNDTYLKLWRNIEHYDMKKASLRTWLKVIVRNTALNRLRDIKKHEENLHIEDFSDIAAAYADCNQNIENQITGKEQTKHLNEVIIALSRRDRELVLRRYFYLQSSKTIAKAMDMTINAVDSKLSRLRIKMKRSFDELESEERRNLGE